MAHKDYDTQYLIHKHGERWNPESAHNTLRVTQVQILTLSLIRHVSWQTYYMCSYEFLCHVCECSEGQKVLDLLELRVP